MDPEEQEALSRKYLSLRVLPLESGRFALFDCSAKLLAIASWYELERMVPKVEALLEENATRANFRQGVKPVIDLEELGL